MAKGTHTALKEAARQLAEDEGLTYATARRIVERWQQHTPPSEKEITAAIQAAEDFDPTWYYAKTASEIPGHMMMRQPADEEGYYPRHDNAPAPYTYHRTMTRTAPSPAETVLSLIARPAIYREEVALIVEPVSFTGPDRAFGLWANLWSVELHDLGFRSYYRQLPAEGWSGHITPGPEVSAPSRLRLEHTSGYILIDVEVALAPDWVVFSRFHPEGVPVFVGPGAGATVPAALYDEQVNRRLATADLIVGRIPLAHHTARAESLA